MMFRKKVWLGIGAAAFTIAAGPGIDPAWDLSPKITLVPVARASGSEAAGQGRGSAIVTDEGIAAQLLMMKGHLAAGLELADAGHTDQAVPLLKRPLEELWTPIHEVLEERDERIEYDIEIAIAGAEEAAESGDAAAMETAAAGAIAAIDRALETLVPAARRRTPVFAAAVARIVLEEAVTEYREAVAEGRVVEVADYQAAYGLVTVAVDLMKSLLDDAENVGAARSLAALLDELKAALPSASPPKDPFAPGRFRGLVSRIELELGALV